MTWDKQQLDAARMWPTHKEHGEPGFIVMRHSLLVSLLDEVERLTRERDAYRDKRDILLGQYDRIIAERDTAWAERDAAVRERDELMERAKLSPGSAALKSFNDLRLVRAERDALLAEVRAWRADDDDPLTEGPKHYNDVVRLRAENEARGLI